VLATMVIRPKRHRNFVGGPFDRLPGTSSKFGMSFLRRLVNWVRSRAGAVWKAVAPHAGPGVACGAAVDVVRGRRELVIENAMLRHQIIHPPEEVSEPEAHGIRPVSASRRSRSPADMAPYSGHCAA
jgi:hypothetical protein